MAPGRVLVAAAVVIAAVLIVAILGNAGFTGQVAGGNADRAPRHVFYGSPRAEPNLGYQETCYPASEVMPVIPGAKCCAGLAQLGIIDEAQEGCQFLTGGTFCSDCGNGRCDYGENECNCPQDCNKPPKRL